MPATAGASGARGGGGSSGKGKGQGMGRGGGGFQRAVTHAIVRASPSSRRAIAGALALLLGIMYVRWCGVGGL